MYLLYILFFVRQEDGHVEHDVDAPPVGVDRRQAREVVHRVQASFVLVKSCRMVKQSYLYVKVHMADA